MRNCAGAAPWYKSRAAFWLRDSTGFLLTRQTVPPRSGPCHVAAAILSAILSPLLLLSTLFHLDHLLPLPLLHHLHLLSPYLYFITFIYSFTSSPHSLLSRIALYSGDRYPGPLRHHHLLRRHPLGEASSFLSMHLVFISEINVYNPYLSFI